MYVICQGIFYCFLPHISYPLTSFFLFRITVNKLFKGTQSMTHKFSEIGRLPLPGDNVGIATCNLDKGTQISHSDRTFALRHTILEGHRFAIQPIAPGEPLLSWGLPFGIATHPISPGDYACNPEILDALKLRDLDFELPGVPNFEDRIVPHQIDATTFEAGEQVKRYDQYGTFQGVQKIGRPRCRYAK